MFNKRRDTHYESESSEKKRKVEGNESFSIALSFPKAKVPENELDRSENARERKDHGANWPGSKLARFLLADSLHGTNWRESEKARYHFI